MSQYQKPPELYEGLRLHQNENTGGCSPRVLEALASLRPEQIGFYPPYAAATERVAQYLGVSADGEHGQGLPRVTALESPRPAPVVDPRVCPLGCRMCAGYGSCAGAAT